MLRTIHREFIAWCLMMATGTLRKEKPRGTKEACSEERANAQAWDNLAEMDRLPRDDRAGLAAAAYSPVRSRCHRLLIHDAAERSSAEDRGPTRPTSAGNREPTRRSRAEPCGAAYAGRGAASIPRSDESPVAREKLTC